MVEFDHVWVERGGRVILFDVDLKVERGEFVFLVGPTGAGKSTLVRLAMLEERPSRGEVRVGEFTSSTVRERDIPFLRRRLGVVFQDFRLLRDRTVYENVAFALAVTGAPRRMIQARVLAVLAQTELLHRRDARPGALSGGEQQAVAIARALVNEPFLLLADEPTAHLDGPSAERVMRLFGAANAGGASVVMATHDIDLVRHYRHRKVELRDGRVSAA